MPRIQAIDQTETTLEVSGDVLTELTKNMPQFTEISEALDHHNAGIGDIAQTVGYIMKWGASDAAKLNAARLASELRGVAKGKDTNTINFIISDVNGVNLMNIFNPQR